jgi:hypothetical protein
MRRGRSPLAATAESDAMAFPLKVNVPFTLHFR